MSTTDGISIDAATVDRQIETLAAISEAPAPVVTRVLFSEADLAARRQIDAWCREAGLTVRTDAAGNGFARWTGADPALPPVATGSHIDAIPNAGRFDGVVGVVGALGAIRGLQRAGFQPRRSIELITFTAEEPTRFGLGCLGSRLLGGALDPATAGALADRDGRTFDDWRAGAGCWSSLETVPLEPGAYQAFVELHIEQGPLLERDGLDIGAVEKIAAPAALRVRLEGVGGHAGAVLMPDRHDALLAGAEITLAVERAAFGTGSPDTVGTTGVFRVAPGAINSVPSFVELEIDLRDTNLSTRETVRGVIENAVAEICTRRGVRAAVETINADPPAACDPAIVETILRHAQAVGLGGTRMISRAYHDTLFIARICPVGMIFIPCRGGVSHRPDEFASSEAIHHGVSVLAGVLAELASK